MSNRGAAAAQPALMPSLQLPVRVSYSAPRLHGALSARGELAHAPTPPTLTACWPAEPCLPPSCPAPCAAACAPLQAGGGQQGLGDKMIQGDGGEKQSTINAASADACIGWCMPVGIQAGHAAWPVQARRCRCSPAGLMQGFKPRAEKPATACASTMRVSSRRVQAALPRATQAHHHSVARWPAARAPATPAGGHVAPVDDPWSGPAQGSRGVASLLQHEPSLGAATMWNAGTPLRCTSAARASTACAAQVQGGETGAPAAGRCPRLAGIGQRHVQADSQSVCQSAQSSRKCLAQPYRSGPPPPRSLATCSAASSRQSCSISQLRSRSAMLICN